MNYKNILITGGAGFVGSNIGTKLKEQFSDINVTAFDNLYRRGSELNLPRLKKAGIKFIKGDVRNKRELNVHPVDLVIECCAEPSVLAGTASSPEYLIDTNLNGAINCFELARINQADVVFISTSRIYPTDLLNQLNFRETEQRFDMENIQPYPGASVSGISEKFPLDGIRSLYGATKLSAELLLREYVDTYGIRAVINRCGVIAGPWQFGKTDQGIVAYWLAAHVYHHPLEYIGFGGYGKQVRDILHIDDLSNLLITQLQHIRNYSGKVFNVGGGLTNSISLRQLTELCQDVTGTRVTISQNPVTRKNDIKSYISDNSQTTKCSGWLPEKNVQTTVYDTLNWMTSHKTQLEKVFTA